MSEITRITRKDLTKAGIIPEAQGTFLDIQKRFRNNPKETLTDYGHAGELLGQVIAGGEYRSSDRQKDQLRDAAQRLIEKYGERIKDVMRPELLEALGFERENSS